MRPGLVAFVVLVLAAFGLGPSVSPALAKGGEQITPKVIGGTVAPDGSWPSQAYVEIERSGDFYSCGGTLIDPYWVLTAAHCVVDEDGDGSVSAGSVVTAIGINDLRDIEPSDVIGIQSILIHPDYQALLSGDRWDFALLELALPSDQPTTPLIEPGQEAFTVGGSPGKVAGWGCTSQSAGTCLAQPFLLQEADVSFISDALCGSGDSYGGSFDPEIMVCAGNFETGTPDTCYGDSGGPLIAFGPEGEAVLAGVTSFGNECALPDYPGVYARVIAARGWILTTIEENLRLEVTRSGTGSGTVTSSPTGISCGSDCSNDFSYGTEVTLIAKAASGSGFTGWSGACSGTGSCVLTIREASSVTANFKKGPTVSLKTKPPKRTHSRKATFRFRASQSDSTFRCRLDGRNWRKCKSPKTYKNLKRGRNHTFRVKATKGGITGPVKKYTWNVKRH